MHSEKHPQAGETVRIRFAGEGRPQVAGREHDFVIEDWWDHLTGGSWMFANGNPAATVYAIRAGLAGLRVDDDVVYGHIGNFGHLVHSSEITAALAAEGRKN